MVRWLLALALTLVAGAVQAQPFGAMSPPSQQCVLQSVNLSNNVIPSGVAGGTPIGTVSVSTNATASITTWDQAFSSTNPTANFTYSADLLTVTGGGVATFSSTRSTTTQLNKKVYFRLTYVSVTNDLLIGAALGTATASDVASGSGTFGYNASNGQVAVNNAGTVATIQTAGNGDYSDLAMDEVTGLLWIRTNGPGHNWNNSGTANPSTETGGINISAITASNILYIYYTSGFDTNHSATLDPAPTALQFDNTLTGFSPWQPFNQINCNSATVSIDDTTHFAIASSSPPTTLSTVVPLTAGIYPLNIAGAITGAQNSPRTLPTSVIATGGGTEAPGPSAALFAAPFYTCVQNFYVATTGSDSNDGSLTHPWLTIQHANDVGRTAGDCVNVSAGLYNANVLLTSGGNAPTPTGYVTYRCVTLDGCHVLAPGAGRLWGIRQPANFVVVDGFELDGNNALLSGGIADACIASDGDTYGIGNSSHHVWVLNNIVHDCTLAGITFANKEWYYIYHNRVYNTARESPFQGSGIGLVVIQCIEAGVAQCASGATYQGGTGTYVPSGMDLTFSQPYHVIAAFNDVHNNGLALDNPVGCGNHTDGNGIIWDTWFDETTHSITYPYQSLIWGNASYLNGARGIHVFATSNVTIANNTVYSNDTDTCIPAFAIGDLNQSGGANNNWVNNVAYTVNTVNNPAQCSFCGGRNYPLVAGDGRGVVDINNTYTSNLLFGGLGNGQPALFQNDVNYFSTLNNKTNTDPSFVSLGSLNFALNGGSPAISYGMPVPNGLFSLVANANSGQFVDSGSCYHTLTTCP